MRKILVIAVSVLMLASLVTDDAHALRRKAKTTVDAFTFDNNETVGDPSDYFIGEISSSRGRCVDERKVEVWKDLNGNDKVDPDTDLLIGTGETFSGGMFEILAEDPGNGDYILVVKGNSRCRKAIEFHTVDTKP
jgi:hypothetical protein